jgi:hypothetical protein
MFFKLSPCHHIIVVQHNHCTKSFFPIIVILEIVLVHWIRSWVKEIHSTRLSPLYTIVRHNYYSTSSNPRLVPSFFTIIMIEIVLLYTWSYTILLRNHNTRNHSTGTLNSFDRLRSISYLYYIFRRTCHKIKGKNK